MTTSSKYERKLLHYTGKAIADYQLIKTGDKVLVCVSGGKDSLVMARLLHLLQLRSNHKFTAEVFILDQGLPGFDASEIKEWLEQEKIPCTIHHEDTYSIVRQKAKDKKYCMLCSRLRRGIIYSYAKKNNFNKIALGHHRDDLIVSLFMSILYRGEIASMPPKLLTNDQANTVIRPLCLCQEHDIAAYATQKQLPVITTILCAAKENPTRNKLQQLLTQLATDNPKILSNALHALQRVRPSHLMDQKLWPFKNHKES